MDEILDSLKWLGLDWDEIHFQSKRFSLYSELAKKLLSAGKAYEAEDGSGAIILKMPRKEIVIDDLIHGQIKFDTQTIKDQVLIKSDGSPTYSFACVVDDADLKISHVIRGDDHISNTPKQVVIYEALGFQLPFFAHIPMILSGQGGRLSKRTGATAISEYRQMGFLPEAIINYLTLLGWSPGNDQEIISKEESAEKFSIKDINDTAAAFDQKKLEWFNNQYLKNMDPEEILDIAMTFFKQREDIKIDNFSRDQLLNVVKLFRERINTIPELVERSKLFFDEELDLTSQAKDKLLEKDITEPLKVLKEEFNKLKVFDHVATEEVFRNTIDKFNAYSLS